jgi:hypothetical protein
VSRPTQVRIESRRVFAYRAFTFFGRPSQCRSPDPGGLSLSRDAPYNPADTEASTVWAVPRSLATTEGISSLISFPPGTEMVQFPGCRPRKLCIHLRVAGNPTGRVTPFGHLWIAGCLLLPTAFRSLPRPSSPDSSKASTVDPYSLDHIIRFPSLLIAFLSKNSVPGPHRFRSRPSLPSSLLITVLLVPMEVRGFEPLTYGLQSHRSSQLSYTPWASNSTHRWVS